MVRVGGLLVAATRMSLLPALPLPISQTLESLISDIQFLPSRCYSRYRRLVSLGSVIIRGVELMDKLYCFACSMVLCADR